MFCLRHVIGRANRRYSIFDLYKYTYMNPIGLVHTIPLAVNTSLQHQAIGILYYQEILSIYDHGLELKRKYWADQEVIPEKCSRL